MSEPFQEQIEQRTDSWLEFRSKGIGASDVAALMDASPWMTPLELYEQKIGVRKPFEGNYATERGNRLEPAARAQVEMLLDADFPPMLAIHPEYPHIRASLDGYNAVLNAVLEIKCPGRDDHKSALNGKIPDKYIYQLQHQLLVTGAVKAYYYSFDGEQGCIVEVFPDPELQQKILTTINDFWFNHVQKKIPPMLSFRDYLHVVEPEAVELMSQWKVAKLKLDEYAALIEKIKLKILDKFKSNDHPRIHCAGVNIVRSTRKGAIDYSKIKDLNNINLEQYRKPAVTVVTLSLE